MKWDPTEEGNHPHGNRSYRRARYGPQYLIESKRRFERMIRDAKSTREITNTKYVPLPIDAIGAMTALPDAMRKEQSRLAHRVTRARFGLPEDA